MTIQHPMFPPPVAANVFTLPADAVREIPTDPDAVRAIIKLGRHLGELDRRMGALWGTPSDSRNLPRRLREVIEACVDWLDMLGPDPDLEDEREDDDADLEADLGWSNVHSQQRLGHGDEGGEDDRGEPSLGSLQNVDQSRWGMSGTRELEDEHDGREQEYA